MHLTLSLIAATTLLLAAVLGLRRRTQPAVGITVAATNMQRTARKDRAAIDAGTFA